MKVKTVRRVQLCAPYALCVLTACSQTAEPVDLSSTDLKSLLDEAVDEGLPGVIIWVDAAGEGDDYRGAAGFADRSAEKPMTLDTRFRIASNTKSFVGLAAAQQHATGKLDLDAMATNYIESTITDKIENADTATVRQLLNHSAGTYDYLASDGFWDAVDNDPTHVWSAEEALAFAFGEKASFAAGTGWEYSNTNFLLAGLAIDSASGAHHSRAIRQGILEPLDMNATYYEHHEAASGTLAHGYQEFATDDVEDTFAYDSGYGLADGGMITTAGDLATYIGALGRQEPRLGDAALAELFASPAMPEDGEKYGLGISRFTGEYGEIVGHGGNVPGYNSDMFYHPDTDTIIVIMANGSDGHMDAIYEALVDRTLKLALGKASK